MVSVMTWPKVIPLGGCPLFFVVHMDEERYRIEFDRLIEEKKREKTIK
jgi:hypothetical protein